MGISNLKFTKSGALLMLGLSVVPFSGCGSEVTEQAEWNEEDVLNYFNDYQVLVNNNLYGEDWNEEIEKNTASAFKNMIGYIIDSRSIHGFTFEELDPVMQIRILEIISETFESVKQSGKDLNLNYTILIDDGTVMVRSDHEIGYCVDTENYNEIDFLDNWFSKEYGSFYDEAKSNVDSKTYTK